MKKQHFSLLHYFYLDEVKFVVTLRSLVGGSWKHVAFLHSLVLQSQFLPFVSFQIFNIKPQTRLHCVFQ